MATYLQGVTPYIPQIQPFQEDFNFYANVLQQKQSQYDANYKALNDIYGQYFYADMLREDNLERKAELIKTIDQNLRKASGTDLSLQQNVNAAKQIFKPFYEDKALMKDIAFTNNYKNELSKAQSLKNCVGGDCPEGYWDGGVRLLHYQAEDFKNATADKALNFQNPTYTPYVNVMKEANAAVKAAGFKITYEASNGRYMVKTENGDMAIGPLRDFLIQNFGNDPRFVDFYKAQADLTLREQPEQAIDIYEQQMLRRQAKTPEEYQRLVKQRAEEKALVRSKEYITTVATNAKKDSEESELFSKSWEEYAAANQGLLPPDAAKAEEARVQAQVSKQTYEQVAGLANSVNKVAYYDGNGQRISDDMIKQTVAGALMLSDLENTATTIAQATFSQTIKGADPYALAQYRSDLSLKNYTQKKIIDLASTLDATSSTPTLLDNNSNRKKFEDHYNKTKAGKNITHTPEQKEQLYQDWLIQEGADRMQAIQNLQYLTQGRSVSINSKQAEKINQVVSEDPNPSENIKPRSTSVETVKPDGKPASFLPKSISILTGFKAVVESEKDDDKAKVGVAAIGQDLEKGETPDGTEFGLNDAIEGLRMMVNSHSKAFNAFAESAFGGSKNYNNQLIRIFQNKLTDPNFQNTALSIYKEIKSTFKKDNISFPENITNATVVDIINKLNEANEADPVKLFKNFTSSAKFLTDPEEVQKEILTDISKNPFKAGKVISKASKSEAFKYSLDKNIKLKALGIDPSDPVLTELETIIIEDQALKDSKYAYNTANLKAINQMIQRELPAIEKDVLQGSESNAGKFTATKYAWDPKENNGNGGFASPAYMFNKLLKEDVSLLKTSTEIMRITGPMSRRGPLELYTRFDSFLKKLKDQNISLDKSSLVSLLTNFSSGISTTIPSSILQINPNFKRNDIKEATLVNDYILINNTYKVPISEINIPKADHLLKFIPSEKEQKKSLKKVFDALGTSGSSGNIPGEGSLFIGTAQNDWNKTIPTMHAEYQANSLENNPSDFSFISKTIENVNSKFTQVLKTHTGNELSRAVTTDGTSISKDQIIYLQDILKQNWTKEKDQEKIPKLSVDIKPFTEHGLDIAEVTIQITGGDKGLRDKLGVTTNADLAKKSKDKANPLNQIPNTYKLYVNTDEIEDFKQIQRNMAWNTMKPGKILGSKDDDVYIEIVDQTSDELKYKVYWNNVYNPETNTYIQQSYQDVVSSGTTQNIYNHFISTIVLNKQLQQKYNNSNK